MGHWPGSRSGPAVTRVTEVRTAPTGTLSSAVGLRPLLRANRLAAGDRRLPVVACGIVRTVPITAAQKATALGRVPLFAGISDESMARLAEVAGEQDFPTGSFIVRQGQVGTGLYIILSGQARVIRGSEDLALLGPGDFFGELAVIDQQPRMASVQAETDTTLMALASWDLLALLERDPALSLNLIKALAERLRTAGERHHHF
jgi:CRP/FNR family cyclic AMP-dependent transcriptional regulator